MRILIPMGYEMIKGKFFEIGETWAEETV